jgi:tRNA (guanine-N7-)-methyltransferase
MDELLPEKMIRLEGRDRCTPHLLCNKPNAGPVWIEIGFGGGEHLAAQAQLHPDTLFIGCEPFLNGVASLLDHLERAKIQNVMIFNDDARVLLDALPDHSVDRCFILFADPWPKKRHAERRFVSRDTVVSLARVLRPKALLRLASDHPRLIEWMRDVMAGACDFRCLCDSDVAPADWVQTRYQEKALTAGRRPIFMDFERQD